MYNTACSTEGGPVDITKFIMSDCTQRKQFMVNQMKKAFTLLAEDATDMVERIKKALAFG